MFTPYDTSRIADPRQPLCITIFCLNFASEICSLKALFWLKFTMLEFKIRRHYIIILEMKKIVYFKDVGINFWIILIFRDQCSWATQNLITPGDVISWFVSLHNCTKATLFSQIHGDLNSRVSVTHEIQEYWSPTNNNQYTLFCKILKVYQTQLLGNIDLFVWLGFFVPEFFTHREIKITMTGEGLQLFDLCSAFMTIEQWGFFRCHTYIDTGHPIIMDISKDLPWHSHLLQSV